MTWTGAGTSTYALGSTGIELPYSAAANTPAYCKFTYSTFFIPSDFPGATHDATNNKFVLPKTDGPGTVATTGPHEFRVSPVTLHGNEVTA